MDATGTLRLVFDADPWDSTISFAPGIPVARGGTLELDLRARRRRRHPKRPHDRPLRLDRRHAHRRVHRFQPLHLEPHQSLHHRRSDAHRLGGHCRRLQRRRHRRRRRPVGLEERLWPTTARPTPKATPTATTTSTAPTSSPGSGSWAAACRRSAPQTPSPSRRRSLCSASPWSASVRRRAVARNETL